MPNATALPLRHDTVLGVCEALGQDFRFNPLWLRLAFAGLFYWFPLAVIGTYFGLGIVVAASRFLAPVPAAALPADSEEEALIEADQPLPLAA